MITPAYTMLHRVCNFVWGKMVNNKSVGADHRFNCLSEGSRGRDMSKIMKQNFGKTCLLVR